MKKQLLPILFLIAITTSLCRAQTPTLYGLTVMGGDNSNGNIFQYTAGIGVKSVYSFGFSLDGSEPWGSLVYANNKQLYGMTKQGGTSHIGTIFSYNIYTGKDTVLHSFTGGSDGAGPTSSLIQATNNLLYGMTDGGGSGASGIIFSYDIKKDTELVLYSFAGGTNDGSIPYGSLTQVNDSMLYGMTLFGGAEDSGTIFSYNINSGKETLVHSFAGDIHDGGNPWGSLLLASDGLLYGMTAAGGADSMGVIFTYNISTSAETVVHSFKVDTFGRYPNGSLIQAKNGLLYGMTISSGSVGNGVIFSFDINAHTEKLVHNFPDLDGGERPYGALMQASDGNLYGMTSAGGVNNDGILFSYDITDSTFNKILDFNGPLGWQPYFGNLVEADTAVATSVKPLAVNDRQLSIYPNPTSNFIHTDIQLKQTDNLQLRLVNMLGQTVWSAAAGNVSAYQKNIPVADLPGGVYLLEMVTGSGTETRRVVVTH